VEVGIFVRDQAGLIGLHWRFHWWSKFGPFQVDRLDTSGTSFFPGVGDFGNTGALARFWGVPVFLLDAATFFARFTVFFFPNGISSGRGSFCCGFLRVTILVNITGAGVDIFPVEIKGKELKYLV
jgi:hypothetical protein